MLNLSLHGDTEQGDEVHDQDGPEHRHIEQLEEGTAQRDQGGLAGRVPELELWQPADEGSELFILLGWQLWTIFVIIFRHGWINFWS